MASMLTNYKTLIELGRQTAPSELRITPMPGPTEYLIYPGMNIMRFSSIERSYGIKPTYPPRLSAKEANKRIDDQLK